MVIIIQVILPPQVFTSAVTMQDMGLGARVHEAQSWSLGSSVSKEGNKYLLT